MNKGELIDAMASVADTTKVDAGKLLDSFISAVTDELKTGGKIILPGFGTFSVKCRAARSGRNPKTGAIIKIAAKKVTKFKAGKLLREAVLEEKT